jgi:hypothetical protein
MKYLKRKLVHKKINGKYTDEKLVLAAYYRAKETEKQVNIVTVDKDLETLAEAFSVNESIVNSEVLKEDFRVYTLNTKFDEVSRIFRPELRFFKKELVLSDVLKARIIIRGYETVS